MKNQVYLGIVNSSSVGKMAIHRISKSYVISLKGWFEVKSTMTSSRTPPQKLFFPWWNIIKVRAYFEISAEWFSAGANGSKAVSRKLPH